jgi:hypothetical protein
MGQYTAFGRCVALLTGLVSVRRWKAFYILKQANMERPKSTLRPLCSSHTHKMVQTRAAAARQARLALEDEACGTAPLPPPNEPSPVQLDSPADCHPTQSRLSVGSSDTDAPSESDTDSGLEEPHRPPSCQPDASESEDGDNAVRLNLKSLNLEKKAIPPSALVKGDKIGSGGFKDV